MTGRLKYYCMRIPAALLLAAVLAGLGSCRYAREKGLFLEGELKKAMPLSAAAGTTGDTSVQNSTAAAPDRYAEGPASSSASPRTEISPAAAGAGTPCYIIIGTFTSHANAQAAARKYSSLGYSTSLIKSVTSKGEKAELVAVKSFPDREAAKAYLADFKAAVEPKAWIYPRE